MTKHYYSGEFYIDTVSDSLVTVTQPVIIINDSILVDIDSDKRFTIVSKNSKVLPKKEAKEVLQLYNIIIHNAIQDIMQEYLKEYQNYMLHNYNTNPKCIIVVDGNYIAELGGCEEIKISCNPISNYYIIEKIN